MTRLFTTIIVISFALCLHAQRYTVRWADEGRDTVLITRLLTEAAAERFTSPSAAVAWMGRHLLGTPYVAHTLECDSTEMLTINLGQLDCTTTVETALALAMTVNERRQGWQDFVHNLRQVRYRGGECQGYPSRLHYVCDWVIDNAHRGHVRDITPDLPNVRYIIRSIDFMSGHADRYPQLADSANLTAIRAIENGYRNHRFAYIPTADLTNKRLATLLREGDILAFVSNLRDLDVTHMGIVVFKDGRPHVLHASSTNGRVEISDALLADFVRRNRSWMGVRVLRPTAN